MINLNQVTTYLKKILAKITKYYDQDLQKDEEFIADSKAAMLNKSTPFAYSIFYLVSFLLIAGLIWAYFGKIEEITIGDGKVITSSQIKIIQSLDGGIVGKILVREGDSVKKDQELMQLDDTRYKADYAQAYARYLALAAMVARFNAEVNNAPTIDFPAEVNKYPELVSRENKLFLARKQALGEQLNLLNKNFELADKEVNMYGPLAEKGIVPKIDYIRSQRAANEIKTQILSEKDKFNEQSLTNLNLRKADLAIVMEQMNSLRDKMVHTTIRSPVNGVVKKLNAVTVGGVIRPGENIMEIVPIEDSLLIQAKIQPKDIGFIHTGQKATVKITAYDYSIYGGLAGVAEYVSADAIETNDKSPQTPTVNQHYYLVNIRTDKNYLEIRNKKMFIIPGMMATVHIQTGEKTILQYLLKPLIKAKQEALRER